MSWHATDSTSLRVAGVLLLLLGAGRSDAKDDFQLRDVSPGKLRVEAGGPAMKLSFAGEDLDRLTQALLVPKGGKSTPEATALLGPVERKQRSVVLSATSKATRGAYDLHVGDGLRWIGVPVSLEIVDRRPTLARIPGTLHLPEREVVESGVLVKGEWKQYGPYLVASGGTFSAALTGTGDADLFLRLGSAPTHTAYDCRPYKGGTDEECSAVGTGQVFLGVNGFAQSSTYKLRVTYAPGLGSTSSPPSTFQHLNVSGQVATDEMKVFLLHVPTGRSVVVRTSSASDVDLYLRMDLPPTTQAYLLRSNTVSGNEKLTFTATQASILRIGVHGYAGGAFTLRTSDP